MARTTRNTSAFICVALAIAAMQSFAIAQSPQAANRNESAREAVIQTDVEKFYEQRGYCTAQRDAGARVRCFEKLTSELLSALSTAARQATTSPQPAPITTPQRAASPEPSPVQPGQLSSAWNSVYRAFTAIDASTRTGVSYVQYGPLLQTAATELALVAKDANDTNSKAALAQYELAMDAYRDARIWWEADISFFSKRSNASLYSKGLPFSQVGLDAMVLKWNIGVLEDFGFFGTGSRLVPRAFALQSMWNTAKRAFETAQMLLNEPAMSQSAIDSFVNQQMGGQHPTLITCQTDRDCPSGQNCRSRKGGGTECRPIVRTQD